jgi:hypothetical protein
MSSRFNLDHESFQNLLANAFVIQESGVDVHSLSAVIKLQRTIGSGEVDEQGAMNLVADRARDVANAAGIAVALLTGDELVYRAGSGMAAPYVGRRVTAILSVSQSREGGAEILRVENCDTDTRIEAVICREFGAKSLLILPIYRESRVAGVQMVLFTEPHIFQERELRGYRLMASLLGDAISRTGQARTTNRIPALNLTARREVVEASPARTFVNAAKATAPADGPKPQPAQPSFIEPWSGPPPSTHARQPKVEATPGWVIEKRKSRKQAWINELIKWGSSFAEEAGDRGRDLYARRKSVLPMLAVWNDQRKTALVVAALLVIASWFGFRDRHPIPSIESGISAQSPVSIPQSAAPDVRLVNASTSSVPPLVTNEGKKLATHRKGKAGTSDVVYLSDDVTVRYFKPKSAPKATSTAQGQVHHISDDVTVRYFTPKQELDAKSAAGNTPRGVTR